MAPLITAAATDLMAGGEWKNRAGLAGVVAFWFGLQRGRCWWCGELMHRPEILRPQTLAGKNGGAAKTMRLNQRDRAATIEHLLPRGDARRNTLLAVRLAHNKCNRTPAGLPAPHRELRAASCDNPQQRSTDLNRRFGL